MEYTEELLEQLVRESASESQTLEFKRELPRTSTRAEKAEFAKDIVGMANSSGGTILYGIASHHDCAAKLMPIASEPADAAMRRLEMTLAGAVEPREVRVRFRPVQCAGGYVLEATVSRSYIGPHRVVSDAKSHFYFRSNTQVREFTYRELRDAFLGREHAGEKFRRWRLDRLYAIEDGKGARPLLKGVPLAVLHAAPLEVFERSVSLDPHGFYQQYEKVVPGHIGAMSSNYNLDGVVTFQHNGSGTTGQYVQVFRTGPVEFVFKAGFTQDTSKVVAAPYIADLARNGLRKYAKLFSEQGFAGPSVFALSVVRLGGFHLNTGGWEPAVLDREDLHLPEVVVAGAADVIDDVDATARPLLDMFWQCFDVAKCPYYDSEGQYRQPR